jgi:hypothetical protein
VVGGGGGCRLGLGGSFQVEAEVASMRREGGQGQGQRTSLRLLTPG